MSGYGINNLLVEYFRYVALTKNGAVWTHHTTAIISYRSWLSSIWEGIGSGKGQPIPVMFETRSSLEEWAFQNNHKLDTICVTNKKEPNAYAILGDDKAIDWYRGTYFLWVRASWRGYRTAFKVWLNQNRSGDSLEYLHNSAIECYESAIKLVKIGVIFKGRTPKESGKIIKLMSEQIFNHRGYLNFAPDKMSGSELFSLFDYTLDADHVVNKSSLRNLPDAWVLMAPVPADANRGFGSLIERHYPKYKQGKDRLELDPITAFKLFASIMPASPQELEHVMTFVRNQMGGLGELDVILNDMYIQMKKYLD